MERKSAAGVVLVMLGAVLACSGTGEDGHDHGSTSSSSSSSSGSGGPLNVTLNFKAVVGDQPLACGTEYTGIGTSNSAVRVTDARFYVHDVRLITSGNTEVPVTLAQDGTWQKDDVALLDFETGGATCSDGTTATHTAVTGTVPAGTYTGLAFKVGVPFALTHQDTATAPAPLNLTPLWWNWNGGYKFLKVDLSSTGVPGGWFIHLGSTGCTPQGDNNPTTCANPNRAEVRLSAFEWDHQAVQLDIKALLDTSNVDMNMGGAPGCMSGPTDPECQVLLPKFGLPIGNTPAGTQSIFSAVHNH